MQLSLHSQVAGSGSSTVMTPPRPATSRSAASLRRRPPSRPPTRPSPRGPNAQRRTPAFLLLDPVKKDHKQRQLAPLAGPRLDAEPELLETQVRWWVQAGRGCGRTCVAGTHHETVDDMAQGEERKRVTDFDVSIELDPSYLYSGKRDPSGGLERRSAPSLERRKRCAGGCRPAEGAPRRRPGQPHPCSARPSRRWLSGRPPLLRQPRGPQVVRLQEDRARLRRAAPQGQARRPRAATRATVGHLDISFLVRTTRSSSTTPVAPMSRRLTSWIFWLSIIMRCSSSSPGRTSSSAPSSSRSSSPSGPFPRSDGFRRVTPLRQHRRGPAVQHVGQGCPPRCHGEATGHSRASRTCWRPMRR